MESCTISIGTVNVMSDNGNRINTVLFGLTHKVRKGDFGNGALLALRSEIVEHKA